MEPVETTSMLQGEIPTNRNHAQVDSLNHWMFERVKPYIRGRVMEIGSGTGDLAAVCFQDQISMYLSDEDETYRDLLNERFADEESLKGVMSVNLKDADFENRYANYIGVFDTIVALDITKPVTIETLAISNCAKLLRKGGYLFIHLPVHTALYNGLDLG